MLWSFKGFRPFYSWGVVGLQLYSCLDFFKNKFNILPDQKNKMFVRLFSDNFTQELITKALARVHITHSISYPDKLKLYQQQT